MNVIVMVDENWGIGKDGDQQVYIPDDLKRFKAFTMDHTVIFGRLTMATFPGGKPLKNRKSILLTKQQDYQVEGATVVHSVEEAVALAPEDSFVIGGASVYVQFEPYCDTAYITKLHKAFPADTYFPNLDESPNWELVEREGPFTHEGVDYSYLTYKRKKH